MFSEAINAIRDYAIFLLDPDGRILTWNRGARRINGYRAEEIVGRHFSIFYTPEDQARKHPEFELKEAKKIGRYIEEGWRVRRDGSRFWANVTITKLTDSGGRFAGFSKVTRDLTERKLAEEALCQANQELEARVRERTADLAAVNEELARREAELERAVRVRDEFLSIASHELKTPITSLKLQLQLLEDRLRRQGSSALSGEKIGHFLETSLRQVNRLTQLVEELLDVARAQNRKMGFHLELVDLRALTEEVLERLRTQLDVVGCEVALSGDPVLEGEFDRSRMDQVLVNLLMNAVKYAPGSPIQIRITRKEDLGVLWIQDQGPGILREDQERIFRAFERGKTSRNISGLGLGLFLTQQIVQGHGGRITLSSEPGLGAAFLIEVPLEQKHDERSSERKQAADA